MTTLFTPLEVHLAASAPTPEGCLERILPLEEKMRQELGQYCYGQGQQSLAEVVGQALLERKATLVTAESLTGGLVAWNALQRWPAPASILGGWVCYSEALKHQQLGVPWEMLREHGAVSQPVAHALALNAQHRSGADYALAFTGYAGPSGGTEQDPVGTVYLALATPAGIETEADQASRRSRTGAQSGCPTWMDWLRRRLGDGR